MERHSRMPCILLRRLIPLLLMLGCTGTGGPASAPSAALPIETASGLMLPAPSDPDQRLYLGIGDRAQFSISDIQAEIVLIEVFDFYCQHCQREAPAVNRLYLRIAGSSSMAKRIKIIGIGVNNTSYEVNRFRKVYDIKFPLFPDRSRLWARRLEVAVTPTFVAFAHGSDGRLHPILHSPGPLGNVEQFLNRLLERAEAAEEISNRPSFGNGSLPAAMVSGNARKSS